MLVPDSVWELSLAGISAAAGAAFWLRIGRGLPEGPLRTFLSDFVWTPAFTLAFCALIQEDLKMALAVTIVIAPIGALRNVLFALSWGKQAFTASGVDDQIRREREARQKLFSEGQSTHTDI